MSYVIIIKHIWEYLLVDSEYFCGQDLYRSKQNDADTSLQKCGNKDVVFQIYDVAFAMMTDVAFFDNRRHKLSGYDCNITFATKYRLHLDVF